MREFEHGLVLANPSHRPQTFDLGNSFPAGRSAASGARRNRIRTNNGSPVGETITLGERDAIFLRNELHRRQKWPSLRMAIFEWSGRQDSNLRPLHPQ